MDIKKNLILFSLDFSYLVVIQKIFIIGTFHSININDLYTVKDFKYFSRYLHHEPYKSFYVVDTIIFNYNLGT